MEGDPIINRIQRTHQCDRCAAPTLHADGREWTLPLSAHWIAAIHAAQPDRPLMDAHLEPAEPDTDSLLDGLPIPIRMAAHRCGPQPPTTGQADHLPPY